MPRALLIFNPNAGRYPPEPVVRLAADELQQVGWDLRVETTRDAVHVTQLASQAVQDGCDALIVGGGDGSLGLTISALAGSGTALGVLPTGTANVLAKQLNLPEIRPQEPETIRQISRLIAASVPRAIDIGMCNHETFLLWAGLGFDAMVVARSEQNRSHWKKRFAEPEYFVRAIWTAHHWPGMDCEIIGQRADGQNIFYSGNVQIAVATNIPLYAGGLVELSPDAVLDDGEMDLWLFKGQGSRQALLHAWNLFKGKHVQNPDVIQLRFACATVRSQRPVPIHTDGDPHRRFAEVELSVRRKCLKLLIPPTAPERLFLQ